MANCLKTQLKGDVQNDNLEKFDVFTIIVKHSEVTNRVLPIKAVAGTEVKASGGTFSVGSSSGTYSDSYTFVSNSAYAMIYPANPKVDSEMKLEFKSKYGIRGYNNADGVVVNVANFKYIPVDDLKFNGTNGIYGTFETIYPEVIKYYNNMEYVSKNNITTYLSSFEGAVELLVLNLNSNANAFGSIVSLGQSIKLVELTTYNCTNIVGEVNDLASAMVAAGRTSGRLVITARRSKMTDDGNEITDAYMETKNATKIIINFNSSEPGGYIKSYEI